MENDKSNVEFVHLGFTGNSLFTDGLALMLIGLKLADVIDWEWSWVLAPMWVPVAFSWAFFLFFKALAASDPQL